MAVDEEEEEEELEAAPRSGSPNAAFTEPTSTAAARDHASLKDTVLLELNADATASAKAGASANASAVGGDAGITVDAENGRWVSGMEGVVAGTGGLGFV